jgi:dTDP-glucose 4,6-dehydratase
MKILVTGGLGFIGSHFVCQALSLGHTVINIDKLTYAGRLENLGTYQTHAHYVFYRVDICDQRALEEIFLKHQPDCVVHMAAETHVDRSIADSAAFIQTNVCGTHYLLEAAKKYYHALSAQNVFRFLHVSTDEVFGALGSTGYFDETSPYRPNSPYAASKASSDLLVRSYYKTYGLPAMLVNAANNYGTRQNTEKLIPHIIWNALNGTPIPVYGEGKQVREWLFVEDHVEALFAILERGQTGESYCVGSGQESENLSIVHGVCDALKDMTGVHSYRHLITFVSDRLGHDFRYASKIDKIKAHTGWQPKTMIPEGIKKTVSGFLDQNRGVTESVS